MIELLNNILLKYDILLGISFIFLSFVTALWGNVVFKLFLSILGFIVGFIFGAFAGITLFENFWGLFIIGFLSSAVFSMSFYLYSAVGLFSFGFIVIYLIIALTLQPSILINVLISSLFGLLSTVFRRISLSVWLSLTSGLLLFLGMKLLFYDRSIQGWMIGISVTVTVFSFIWQIFLQNISFNRKPVEKDIKEKPES